mmetsp:Transcript_115261/g.367775  ORF Transcript_115261/g.367775 Transcript_115261/m.367775 type:complete len:513 (-) Transcript_115261:115-1653(-)
MHSSGVRQRCPKARHWLRLLLAAALAGAAALVWQRRRAAPAAPEQPSLADAKEPTTIVVFTLAGCPFCVRAKALLEERDVNFDLVDLNVEPQRRAEAAQLSGASTVPQIFVGQRCLGGFDDIKRLDDNGELLAALEPTPEDGTPIRPTPAELLDGRAFLSQEALAALAPVAESLETLDYDPGSSPTLRGFLAYAVTGRPSQGQKGNVPLNLAAMPGEEAPAPALPDVGARELAVMLRQAMLHLLNEFSVPSSGRVDYFNMKDSAEWAAFRAVAAELSHPRLREELLAMDEAERKALLINLYNAMTFHGVVEYGRRSGLWNLYCFYIAPAVSYSLAGVQVSLDDVENGLLRAQPGYFQHKDADFQRQLRMSSVDPRIHMALNCGARGCPAVAVYHAEMLDEELDEAVVAFVSDDNNVQVTDMSEDTIEVALTELFKMYLADFAGEGAKPGRQASRLALLRWLLPYLRGVKAQFVSAALATDSPPHVRVEWLPYDWATNGPDLPLKSRIYRLVP